MAAWQSRADILTWWRADIAAISQRALADRLAVARTAVTNWERGTRLASVDIDRLDEALSSDGALAGLLWSVGSPDGLAAGRLWTNVYRGASSPVWMWIRSRSPQLTVHAEWGMYGLEIGGDLPPNGRFITLGGSIDESPLRVLLSADGWVDFGRGTLPDRIPGAEVHDALELVQPGSAVGEAFNDLLSANLAAMLTDTPRVARQLDAAALTPISDFLRERERERERDRSGSGSSTAWPARFAGIDHLERSDYTRLREARKLSLGETTTRLAADTGISIGKDTLRRYEAGRGAPNEPTLPVALDHVLGANGHLALVALRSGHGPGTVTLPPYWDAPVWLELAEPDGDDPGGRPLAELEWGGWRRSVTGAAPQVVIIHGAPHSLRITTRPSVRWVAGVGRRQGAEPIDHGWLPTSVDATREAISAYQDALIDAARSTTDRLRRRGPTGA